MAQAISHTAPDPLAAAGGLERAVVGNNVTFNECLGAGDARQISDGVPEHMDRKHSRTRAENTRKMLAGIFGVRRIDRRLTRMPDGPELFCFI